MPQEGLPGDAFRSALLCPQPQSLGQSVLQAEMDCDLHSSLQVCEHLPWAHVGCGLVSFQVAVMAPAPGLPQLQGSHVRVHPLQPLFFPVDTNCNGVFRHRSISPTSLLDTTISEEVRQGQGLEEEQEAQMPLPSSSGRRHTLAEVSTCFSPGAPPCKCSPGPHWPRSRSAAWVCGRSSDRMHLFAGQPLLVTVLRTCHLFSSRGHTG